MKKKLKLEHSFFIFGQIPINKICFLLFVSTLTFAQKKISYVVTEESYYEIPPNADLKNVISQDLILMKPSKEKYKITRELKGNKIEETKEFLVYDKTESWLPDIKKIVTDNFGTKIFNSKGLLIFEREHPLEVKNILNEKVSKKYSFIDYIEIPDLNQLKNDPELTKAKIKGLDDSKIIINRNRKTEVDGNYIDDGDTEEIEIDNANLP